MKYFLLLLLTGYSLNSFALTDTSAYQTQRNKVNRLLAERSARFDRYEESLTMRTGIFGLKTKNDMQRSMNILSEIVKTDNNILRETKILLEYNNFEKNQVERRSVENEGRVSAYLQTIRKLQQENNRLKEEIEKVEKKRTKFINTFIGFIVLIVVAAIFLLKTKK